MFQKYGIQEMTYFVLEWLQPNISDCWYLRIYYTRSTFRDMLQYYKPNWLWVGVGVDCRVRDPHIYKLLQTNKQPTHP